MKKYSRNETDLQLKKNNLRTLFIALAELSLAVLLASAEAADQAAAVLLALVVRVAVDLLLEVALGRLPAVAVGQAADGALEAQGARVQPCAEALRVRPANPLHATSVAVQMGAALFLMEMLVAGQPIRDALPLNTA
jgi:hypothetical protein